MYGLRITRTPIGTPRRVIPIALPVVVRERAGAVVGGLADAGAVLRHVAALVGS